MTLQECYDKNDKKGFLVLARNLCDHRKIAYLDYCDLKDIHDRWEYFKTKYPNGRIIFGNLGFEDGKFKIKG